MAREAEACGFGLTLLRFCPPLTGLRRAKKTPGQSPEGALLLVHPVDWSLAHALIQDMAVSLTRQPKEPHNFLTWPFTSSSTHELARNEHDAILACAAS